MENEPCFIHSKCCGGHWELVVVNGIFDLCCENCGKPIGPQVKVTSTIPKNKQKCDCCGEDIDGEDEVGDPELN